MNQKIKFNRVGSCLYGKKYELQFYDTREKRKKIFVEHLKNVSLEKALKYKVKIKNKNVIYKPVNNTTRLSDFKDVVYAFEKKGKIVYIGKSGRGLLKRFFSHRLLLLIGAVDFIYIIPVKTSVFLDYCENYLIYKINPVGNKSKFTNKMPHYHSYLRFFKENRMTKK
jgi:hypothetical protein